MSTPHSSRCQKKPPECSDESSTKTPDSQIDVCHHSRLRFMQRVDASCPNPSQQIRRIFRTGSTADDHPAVGQGRAMRSGDVLVVYRGTVSSPRIVTVLVDNSGDAQ